MKNIYIVVLFLFVLFINNASFGQDINLVKAREYVNQWLGEQKAVDYEIITVDSILENQISYLYLHRLSPKGYVLTNTKNELDIFAYSLEDDTSLEELQKPGVRFFINGFIDFIKEKNFKIDVKNKLVKAEIQAVSPLLTTNWNQDYPYNQYCPVDANGPNGRVYAGCIATAGGMMLKYYNNPVQGRSSHTYTHPTYGSLTANYGNSTYNWTAMGSNNYQEISKLLFHIGVAVNMNYGPDGSGAQTEDLQQAFFKYFYTSPGIYYTRDNMDLTTWKNHINTSLTSAVPVLYDGNDGTTGHIWICDGVNSSGLYHMNWGWGGYSNGYYNLSNLQSLNYDQHIVVNVKPLNASSPKTYVPDNNFENTLITQNLDYDLDDYVYTDVLKGVINMSIGNKAIQDLTGIQDCSNMEKLICAANNISNLNLANLNKLTHLYADNTHIQTANLTGCSNLFYVTMKNNQIQELDFSTSQSINYLNLYNNQLTELDLRNGNNSALTYLNTLNNSNLSCIYVSDKNYCETNFMTNISANTHFVLNETECLALSNNENVIDLVSIFPNPTNGILNISLNSSAIISTIDINNTLGQKIKTFDGNNSSLDINDLNDGVYILNISFSNGNENQIKLIKN